MCLSKLDKVWVHVVNADVAAVEEEPLPDPHHLLPRIVHHCDLDREVVPLDGLQVHARHVERAVTVDQYGQRVGVAHLRADGKRKSGTHDAQATTCDHAARPCPAHKLGRHHLVVPHAGAEEDVPVVHEALVVQVGVDGLDDLLRLDHPVGCLHVGKGVLLLPRLTLLRPLLPCVVLRRLDEPFQGLECVLGICPDSYSRLHHLAETALVYVDVDDSARAGLLGCSCLGCVLVHNAGRAVIEAASYSDNAVGVLDRKIGIRCSVHTEHVQREGVSLVKNAHAVDGGGHRNVGLLCYSAEGLGAVACTLTNVEHWPRGPVDDCGCLLSSLHVQHRGCVHCCKSRPLEDRCWNLCFGGGDVLGQIYVARARAPRASDSERLVHGPRQLIEVQANIVPLGASARNLGGWALLEGIRAHGPGRHLPREDNHGHAVRERVLQRSHQVRHSRATRHDRDATSACRLCIGRG
mmetsp:Transcript_34182/g.79459  ORF Transcript_34182/g.79459 Transcript_34182/m.79459 type:complete len:465 (+) Transcript_34182:462-1856(+)